MSRKFQCKVVPSIWIEHNGRRLDCGPYVSGAIEAKELLSQMNTTPLKDLTTGHKGGIYNGSPFVRNYVEDPDHGVPFLTTSSLLQADLTNLSLLSKRDARSRQLSFLEIKPDMTLITCSGSIGRMAYARSDMKGVWSNQDIMKVVPNPELIKSGYLYAYLCSKFGVPLIASGTYGAIIPHIEPQHIADLPVPRLGIVEDQAHELIQQAANKRVEASRIIARAIAQLEIAAGLQELPSSKSDGIPLSLSVTPSSNLMKRMDGAFHSLFHRDAVRALETASVPTTTVANKAVSIVEPKRFKRIQIDDPEFGIPMFGTSALMWADPQPSYLIPKNMSDIDELLVDQKTVLVPRSGQISGIIGTAVLPYGAIIGSAVSEDAIRINCSNEIIAGFLFIVLRSEYGRRQLKARAYGSSIPHLDVNQIGETLVPDLDDEVIEEIGAMGLQSAKLRHEAIEHESKARRLVERAIEEGGR